MELLVGDKAPPLRVERVLKGLPMESFSSGKIFVVEFWATWCGPCRRSIPHLSALQSEFPSIPIIGVAVRQQSSAEVEDFVRSQGDAMSYTVALDERIVDGDGADDHRGWCYRHWCDAAFRLGIPASFVVDAGGRIAWIGHPLSIGPALEKIVSGEWDLDAEALSHRSMLETNMVRQIFSIHQAIAAWRRDGDRDKVLAVIDPLFEKHPALEKKMGIDKLDIVITTDPERGLQYAHRVVEDVAPDDDTVAFEAARRLLNGGEALREGERPLADRMVASAVAFIGKAGTVLGDKATPRDHMLLDTQMARALLLQGRTEEAATRIRSARARAMEVEGGVHVLDYLASLEEKLPQPAASA